MFWTWLDRYADLGLLIARVGFGGGFIWYHGGPKLFGGTEQWARTGDAMAHFGITFGYEWWLRRRHSGLTHLPSDLDGIVASFMTGSRPRWPDAAA